MALELASTNGRLPVVSGDALQVVLSDVSIVRQNVRILDCLNVSIPLASRTVLLGQNGSGKTTLLHLLQGLIQASSGRVRINMPDRGRRFASVFQHPVMLRRSALANVVHALKCADVPRLHREQIALHALDQVGLVYAKDRSAKRLSGGEQQRLAIARAKALEPMCLLCDEPTASLDPGAAAEIERLLLSMQRLSGGLVMSTHDLAQARRIADHVVFLHRGKVLASQDARSFFSKPAHPIAKRFLQGDLIDE